MSIVYSWYWLMFPQLDNNILVPPFLTRYLTDSNILVGLRLNPRPLLLNHYSLQVNDDVTNLYRVHYVILIMNFCYLLAVHFEVHRIFLSPYHCFFCLQYSCIHYNLWSFIKVCILCQKDSFLTSEVHCLVWLAKSLN